MTWKISVDGARIYPARLEISSDYGVFALGKRPEGFHGWAFKPGKGGVLTVPWVKTSSGEILIGLIHELRPNMGTEGVWSVPGGFVEVNEVHKDAADRETIEESGITFSNNPEELPGEQVNPDRMYYVLEEGDTWAPRMFGLQVPYDIISRTDEKRWAIRSRFHLGVKGESELIFFDWRDAVQMSRDGLTLACIARLLSIIL